MFRTDELIRRGRGSIHKAGRQCLKANSIYDLAICFSRASRVFAAGLEEWGFCPVVSRPSLTT